MQGKNGQCWKDGLQNFPFNGMTTPFQCSPGKPVQGFTSGLNGIGMPGFKPSRVPQKLLSSDQVPGVSVFLGELSLYFFYGVADIIVVNIPVQYHAHFGTAKGKGFNPFLLKAVYKILGGKCAFLQV